MEKITRLQALEMAIKELTVSKADSVLIEKLKEMAKVENKKKTTRKPKVNKEKEENMEKVVEVFSVVNEPRTLTEIGEAIGLTEATPQKLSAIMKPLVDSGEFTKTKKDKKVAFVYNV